MVTGSSSSYVDQAASSLLGRLEQIENQFQRAEVRDPNSTSGRITRRDLRREIQNCDTEIIQLVSSALTYSEKDLTKCLELKEKIYSLNWAIAEVDHSIESRNQTVPSLTIWQRILSLFISYPEPEKELPVFRFNAFCKGLQEKREKLVETELTGMNILVKTESDAKTEAEIRRKVESLSRSMQTGSVAAVAKIGEHAIDLQILSKPERELIRRKITVRITDDGYESDSEVNGKLYFHSLPELLKSYGFTPKTSDESISSIKPYFMFEGAPKSAATAKEHISRLLDLSLQGKGHFCLVKSGDRTFDLLIQPEREGEQIREHSLTVTPQGNFVVGDEIFQNFFELKNKFGLHAKTASQVLVEYNTAKLKTLIFSKEPVSEEKARELLADSPVGAYLIRESENLLQLVGKGADGTVSPFRIDLHQDPGNIRLLSSEGHESARGAKLEECAKRLGLTTLVQASKRSEVIAALREQLDPLKGKGIEARYKAATPEMSLNQTYYLLSYDGGDLESLKEFTLYTFTKEKTGPIASLAGRFGSEKVSVTEKTYRVNTQGQITFGDKVYDSFDAFLESIDGSENFLELEDAYTELKDQPYMTKDLADKYIEQTISALGSSGAKGTYALFEHNGKFFMHIVYPKSGMLWRDREVIIKDNEISLVGTEDTFESFDELKEHFGAREQESVQKQIKERETLLDEVKKLASFNSEGRAVLQNYVKLFGSRADGSYAIYFVQDGEVKEEISIAYVKNGSIVSVVLDSTDASFVEELSSSNTLIKSLLSEVQGVDLQPTKDMKAIAKDYLDITTKESEIKQKVVTIYKEKAVAMKNLLSISEILGTAACDGAYALIENPAKRGEYTALVFKSNTVETYLWDLLSKPGKIVVQPGNSTMATVNDIQALGFKKPVDAYQEDLKAVERQFADLTQSDVFESNVRSVSDMAQFLHLAKLLGDQAKAVWCVRKKEEAKTQSGWTGWVPTWIWSRKEAEPTLELPKDGYCISLIKNGGGGDFSVEDYDISFDAARGKVKVQNTLYNSLDEAIKKITSLPLITTKELVKLHEKAKTQEQIIATQDMSKVCSQAEFGKCFTKVAEYAKKSPYAIFIYPTKQEAIAYKHNNITTTLIHSEQELLLTWPNQQGAIEVRHLNVHRKANEICVDEDLGKHFKSLDDVIRYYCGQEAISLKSVWDGYQEWSKGHLAKVAVEEAAIAPTPEPEARTEKRARGRKSQERRVAASRDRSEQSITVADLQQATLAGETHETRLHDLFRQYPSLKSAISGSDDASTGELCRIVLGRIHGQNFAVGVVGLRNLSSEIQSQLRQKEDKDFIKELIKKAKR